MRRSLWVFGIMFMIVALIGCSGSDPAVVEDGGNEEESGSEDVLDGYPDGPVDVVVAYEAGGGTDVGARLLTTAAEKVSGKKFVVQNRDGAGGEMGYTYLAKSSPDGYTIGFINLPTFVSIPEERSTEYRIDDVEPIILHVYDPAYLVVNKDSQFDDLDSFLSYAEENPNKITVANNGTGASNHIIAAHMEHKAGIELNHVPFDGTNELVTALRGGHVMAGVAKLSEISQHIESGELIPLASMTDERLEETPDVPTLKENGIDVVGASGRGIVAPKGTPQEIIDYLHDVFKEAMETDEHQQQAKDMALPLRYMGPEEFGEFIDEQHRETKELREKLDL